MTFSHFSKDLIRPLSQREKVDVNAHYSLLITHYPLTFNLYNMQLSNNFRLSEFTRSDTAKRLGIVNECSSVEQVLNLAYLCHMVLQPLRDRFGPIRINSGYRCPELNEAVGGVANSYHLRGEAADIHLPSVEKGREYLAFLKTLPAVHELIWERSGNTCWIHVSAKRLADRR